jgi:hypothetical protein
MTSASSLSQARPIDSRLANSPDPRIEIGRSDGGISRLEWIAAGAIFAFLIYLRIRYNFVARFNSDEPQHLHVVWAWATGLLHYKDVFDNHMPLFQLLMAPIFRLFGERADILIWMRFVMLPLFIASVWMVYRIGTISFSRRAGLLAALLVAAWPRFFLKMCEFRTDVLWTVLWLLAVLVAISGAPTRRRSLAVGLLLGATLGVSMKTLVLLVALIISVGGTALFARRAGVQIGWRRALECLASGLAGLSVIPALLVGYFWVRGALRDMYYCVVTHNILPSSKSTNAIPGSSLWGHFHHHLSLIIGGGAFAFFAAWMVFRAAENPASALRRIFLILITASYYILLSAFWPMVTPQDLQPSDADFGICLAPALLWAGDFLARKLSFSALRIAPVLAVGAEILLMLTDSRESDRVNDYLMIKHVDLREDSTSRKVNIVADVLRLTTPGQKIMDGKGETIYRPRASYLVMETITNRRLRLGLWKDTLIDDMTVARVPVIHDPDLMPPADLQWVKENYVSLENVEVLGKLLPQPRDGVISFDVVIPESYTIVADSSTFEGTLDGVVFTGSRFLGAGTHEFRRAAPNSHQKLVLLWARAAQLGYKPRYFLLTQ